VFIESSASEANRNQETASCQESSPRITLIGVNRGCKVTEQQCCRGFKQTTIGPVRRRPADD
jgi:hypothetical protein